MSKANENVVFSSSASYLKSKIMTKLGTLVLKDTRVCFEQNNPFVGPLLKLFGLGGGETFNIPLSDFAGYEQSSYMGSKDTILLKHNDGNSYKVQLSGSTFEAWSSALDKATSA